MEQGLRTLLEHLHSSLVFSGVYVAQCAVFSVVCCWPLTFCPVFIWPFCFRFIVSFFGTFKLFIRKDKLISKTFCTPDCVVFWYLWSILCCMFFFDIRIITVPLVSSNSSLVCMKYFGIYGVFWYLCSILVCMEYFGMYGVFWYLCRFLVFM